MLNLVKRSGGRGVTLLVVGSIALAGAAAPAGADTVSGQIPGFALGEIACPGGLGSCLVATESTGDPVRSAVFPVSAGIPGSGARVPGLGNALACETSSSCIDVGGTGGNGEGQVVPVAGGVPGSPQTVPGTGMLLDVTCPTGSSCVAVGRAPSGQEGVVVPISGSHAGAAVPVPGVALTGVACSSATDCVALSSKFLPGGSCGQNCTNLIEEGIVVPIHDGVPGSPEAVPGSGYLGRVACIPASNRCVAVGPDPGQKHGVVIPITGGVPGTAIPVAGTTGLSGIACVGSGTCQVVGTNGGRSGVRLTVTGTSIGAPRAVPGTAAVGAISCADASDCVALGYTVSDNAYNGTVIVTIGSGATAVIGRDLADATAVGGRAARLSAVLKAGGYPASVAAPAPGLLSIDWYYVPAGAHVSRAAKPTFVAVGAKRFSSAQKTKLVVKLRAPGRKLLGKSKRIKLTAIATFTPKQGKPTSKRTTITLK